MISKEDYETIDKRGYVTEEDIEKYPGIHFCWEWDDMLIYKEDREYECCLCFK